MRLFFALSAGLLATALACSHSSGPQSSATGAPAATAPQVVAMAPPTVGSPAPRGVLEAADGSPLDLAGHFEGHATVLVFYRGFW